MNEQLEMLDRGKIDALVLVVKLQTTGECDAIIALFTYLNLIGSYFISANQFNPQEEFNTCLEVE